MIGFVKQKQLLVSGMVVATCGLAACSSFGVNNDTMDESAVVQQNFADAANKQKDLTPLPEQALDAPVGGGAFVERVPYNALPERFGNAAEDISVAMPIDDIAAMKVLGDDDCDDYRFVELPEPKDTSDKTPCIKNETPLPKEEVIQVKEAAQPKKIEETKSEPLVKEDVAPTLLKGLEVSEAVTEVAVNTDIEDWLAPEGSSLRSLLMDWGDRAGWKVIWKSDREYLLEAGAVFRGRYMDVTAALIRTFARARPAPIATFYKGNKVLLITTLEDENAD